MAKFTLDIEYDYDFSLVGLCCHARDYKLCWAMNNYLGFNFVRQDNLKLVAKAHTAEFSHFTFEDEDKRLEYSLISNRGNGSILVPEHKQADYLLKLNGAIGQNQLNELVNKLKGLELVLTAYPIDINTLKSKQNLLLE